MTGYPKLIDVHLASCGSILLLNHGQRIPLNLTPTELEKYLATRDFPALADICQSQNASVFHLPVRMTEHEWLAITAILRTSPNAAMIREFAELRDGLELDFADITAVPFRLYGGVGQPLKGNGPDLYTSHPFDFRPDTTHDRPWYYCLLNCHGHRLFKTYVNVETGSVKIESGIIKNHFVEFAQ